MRLNLPKHNCVHFAVSSEFTVSEESDNEIQSLMDRTEGHAHQDEEGDTRVAFFGSKFRIAGITHRARGTLYRSVDDSDMPNMRMLITNERASEHLRRPPTGVRPVSYLLDAATRWFGEIEVSSNGIFDYEGSQGFQSRVRFPIPLFIQGDSSGITHVEHAEFSRRIDDDVKFRVSVSEDDESITHSISFENSIQLNQKSITQLFNTARSISSQLIVRIGGENDASS